MIRSIQYAQIMRIIIKDPRADFFTYFDRCDPPMRIEPDEIKCEQRMIDLIDPFLWQERCDRSTLRPSTQLLCHSNFS